MTGRLATFSRRTLPPKEEAPKERPIIESVTTITDPSLEAYLHGRAIPLDLARLHLKEIAYLVDGRRYLALAFENQAGGFEIRNPTFKGTLGTKDITSFRFPGRPDSAVFEGSFDFLSTLAHYGIEAPRSNVIVMNSVALIEKTIAQLKAEQIASIYSYLDHDRAGEDALARLREEVWRVEDASHFYQGYKDANEYLQATYRDR